MERSGIHAGVEESNSDVLLEAVRTVPDFPKPGIAFRDIMPIIGDPYLIEVAVERLAHPYKDRGVTKVVGIESRGFLLGSLLALRLGVGFVPVRKKGKLPGVLVSMSYELEYGTDTIEIQADALPRGARVLIHDDVLATGGTAAACYELIRKVGAEVVGCCFLMELSYLGGCARLPKDLPIHTVLVD